MSSLNHVVQQLQAHRRKTIVQLKKLDSAILTLTGKSATKWRKPKFSAAARARIAAAQRARWARFKASQKKRS